MAYVDLKHMHPLQYMSYWEHGSKLQNSDTDIDAQLRMQFCRIKGDQ